MDDRVSEISCYYSSDEDVAWGPLSIREIRREFSKPNRKPPARRTDFPKHFEIRQGLQKASESVSSGNTEYCTANETVDSDLQSVDPKINDESNRAALLLDSKESDDHSNKLVVMPDQVSENYKFFDENGVIYLSSDEGDEGFEPSRIESEKSNSANIISLTSSDEEGETSNEQLDVLDADIENTHGEKNEVYKVSVVENESPRSSWLNRPKLSKESSSYLGNFENSRYSTFSGTNLKHEFDKGEADSINSPNYVENESDAYHKSIEVLRPVESTNGVPLPNEVDNNHIYQFNNRETSVNSNSSDYVKKVAEHQFIDLESSNKICQSSEESRSISITSSSEVDNDHLYEFNESDASGNLNSSGSKFNENEEDLFLNDTLADIENIINGLEVNSKSDEEVFQTSPKYSVKASRSVSHVEPISRIPILLSSSNENISSNSSSLEHFKIPSYPRSAKKSPFMDRKLTPIKKSPNRFKNIISPIRMYINNSSQPILKQNHRPIMNEPTLGLIPETSISLLIKHRNLVESFPEVIYKPSEKIIKKFDSEIILPNNIKKLVKERTVIKHEVRTRVNLNDSEISTSEKLRRADISCVISDERNMSVHTAKQGFNI